MSIVKLLFGPKWICTHEEGATVTFRARSKAHAKAKLTRFIQEGIYGSWALTYDPLKVKSHVDKCTIKEVEG